MEEKSKYNIFYYHNRFMSKDKDALNFDNTLFLQGINKFRLSSCLPFQLSCEVRTTFFNKEKVSQEQLQICPCHIAILGLNLK